MSVLQEAPETLGVRQGHTSSVVGVGGAIGRRKQVQLPRPLALRGWLWSNAHSGQRQLVPKEHRLGVATHGSAAP